MAIAPRQRRTVILSSSLGFVGLPRKEKSRDKEEEKGKRGERWFIYSRDPGIHALTTLFPLLTKPVSRVGAEHGDVGGRRKRQTGPVYS